MRFIISTVIRCLSAIWRREIFLPRLLLNVSVVVSSVVFWRAPVKAIMRYIQRMMRSHDSKSGLEYIGLESRELQSAQQLHHHCSYYDAVRKRYTIFGGFGNMYYSNKFYIFDLEEARWDTLGSLSGDFLCPRYFSSAGYLDSNHSVYIFYGMAMSRVTR